MLNKDVIVKKKICQKSKVWGTLPPSDAKLDNVAKFKSSNYFDFIIFI